jgi:hypothetical protein
LIDLSHRRATLMPTDTPTVGVDTRTEATAVSHILTDAFGHHTWATGHLLSFCRDLPPEQLTSSAAGTYGDILATLTTSCSATRRTCAD